MRAHDGQASQVGRTNSFAIAALVCGIVQFGVAPACFLAIILGHKARRQIRRTGEGGYGIATAGLILGYFFIASGVLMLVIMFVMNASVPANLHLPPFQGHPDSAVDQ
jgi:hypothetical protein